MFIQDTTYSGNGGGEKGIVPFLFLLYKRVMKQLFEATYSSGEEPKTLIFPIGCFETLPFEVRLMGPWYGCKHIDSKQLKPVHRYQIMQQGYALLLDGTTRVRSAA